MRLSFCPQISETTDPSVGTLTNLNPVMVAADLAWLKHRQVAGLDQPGIFPNGSFNGPVNGNAVDC
jgi:hypothetical protein